MKYQVILDDTYILYDLRDSELLLENPELELEISKVGKLSFSIYPDHPYFDRLIKKSSRISVNKNGKTIFRGRIIEDGQGIYNNKTILCESALAYLNDSIVRPSSFSGSPLEFLTMLLDNHNSQVKEEQKLFLGNVTVTDPNNYISRSWTDYLNSWEVLEKRGLELIGGYLAERYEEDGTYIDWVNDFDDTSTQVIEFGENIIDILAKNNASSTYSVVIPLGIEQDEVKDEEGNIITPKQRLNITSVNDGLDYIVNQEAFNAYGWIVAPVSETTWDDVTLPSNLKTKGEDWLNNQGVMIESELEITALDLQATDAKIESFFIYEYVRIKSSSHNIDKRLLLSKIKIPLAHPESTQITVGESTNTLTGIELGNKQNVDDIIERVGTIEKNYVLNENVSEMVDIAIQNNTSILQDAETIIMTALQDYVTTGDFETFQETISTQFIQTNEDFTFNFNNLVSQITTVEGETQQQFQEINKYIRFIDGTIVLGEAGNELTLVQQNDRISFMQNNSEVAYFSNNELTVTDARFLNSLRIGNFAWKPRANGNLSLVYVGGE